MSTVKTQNTLTYVRRNADGTIQRDNTIEIPLGCLGISDPNSKYRTTRHLLDVVAGRVDGTIDRLDAAQYDYGTQLEGRSPDDPGILEGLAERPYSVTPAEIGKYAASLAASVVNVKDPSSDRDASAGSAENSSVSVSQSAGNSEDSK